MIMSMGISDNNAINMVHENIVPLINCIYKNDVCITISDMEKCIFYQPGKGIDIKATVGDEIKNNVNVLNCMKTGKIHVAMCDLPELIKMAGAEFLGIISPIKENGNVVGSIALSISMKKERAMDRIVTNMLESVNQISAGLTEISSGCQELTDMNSDLLAETNAANKNAKNSDEIVGIIQGISKQTNLLGLNASIEAARAGEYGKGFTVVAQEIRKLSQSSKESIDKIDGIIKNMSNSISSIDQSINKANEVSQTQSAAIEEIAASIKQLAATGQQLEDLAKKF